MSKALPQHPLGPRIVPNYNTDAYGWAMAQAQLIRQKRLELVDWDNVAEEIESVARREQDIAEAALRIVLLNQLKWQHQPLYRSLSWANSIAEYLRRFDVAMTDNPSLAPRLDEILAEAYRRARYEAAQETGRLFEAFPNDPPSWPEIRAPLER